MPITKQQSDRCITHHHACDCREWLFQEVVNELKYAVDVSRVKLPLGETWRDRVGILLAMLEGKQ